MQYSVSPRVKPSSFGPKPERERQHAHADAARRRKCPSSWTKISTPRTNTKARMLVTQDLNVKPSIVPQRAAAAANVAGPAVDGPHVVQPAHRRRAVPIVRVHRAADTRECR